MLCDTSPDRDEEAEERELKHVVISKHIQKIHN